MKIKVYNQVRATVISLYSKLKIHLSGKGGNSRNGDETDEDEIDQVPDFFLIDYEGNGSSSLNLEDKLYILKKALLLEEWKKRRFMIERKERMMMNNTARSGGSSATMSV